MGVPSFKVLILESLLARINALSARSVTLRYVATLDDEAVHDAMNPTAKKVQLTLLGSSTTLVAG